jgi:hypothetical protein
MIRVTMGLILIMCSSCGNNRTPAIAPRKILMGINGEAVYTLNENGSVETVAKEKYLTDDYTILILGDTLELGRHFISYVNVLKKEFTIQIASPKDTVFKHSGESFERYEFMPTKEGIYDYRGIIEYDSVTVPFEYKFIVVPRK